MWIMFVPSLFAQNYISKVWQSDIGDGTYTNPILYADYLDLGVIRVGEDFYMTVYTRFTNSSFQGFGELGNELQEIILQK
ncbi:hypothetical protein [Mariniflexile sp. HMF6888]|uniref:hypothetical protein n=1 Tax=Mariniflexile sp. HMF6888 TaxID=3373086 RepID=UPI0037A7F20F